MTSSTDWYKDNFLVSTKSSLLQPEAVNAAFDSPSMYWCKSIDINEMKKMLEKSLCFGVYELPSSTSDLAGRGNPRQIGLARVITDEVTLAYLTDVYILDEYQGRGLGSWLIQCVNEVISRWPNLRRVVLIASDASEFYEGKLGVKNFEQGKDGFVIMSRQGPGSTMSH